MKKFIKRHPICAGWWITIPGVCDHWYIDPVGILRDIREAFRPSLERRMERLDRRYRGHSGCTIRGVKYSGEFGN